MTKEQEEALKRLEELRDSYELHQRRWANRCLDIIEDYVKNSVYKKMMEETEYLEEDKAIEKLKKYIENDNFYNTYKEVKEDKRKGKIGGTHIDFCKAIETVLSMLKEKSAEIKQKNTELAEKNAEIEELKTNNKKAWKLNANMSKRHLTDIFKIKKKDKIIDLLIDYIDKISEYYTKITGKNNIFCDEKCIDKNIDCYDCIKQYFERKATNNG